MQRILFILCLTFIQSCIGQNGHDCPFPYQNHTSEDLCGFVEVPRDRSDLNSKTTKIGYLVIKAKTENPKPDPVFFLQGGPGGDVLNLADVFSQINLDQSRDFVLFDQRGIGFSEELCPGLNQKFIDGMALDLDITKEIEAFKTHLTPCVNYINSDNRQFGTTTSARDLDDLRKHLGYGEINIFGGSYGTRLGLKYMELYPNHIRTSILSSLFSPNIRMYDHLMSSFNNSIEFLFNACENSQECNTKYPYLKSDFSFVYQTIKDSPMSLKINGSPFILNQQDMLIFVHQMLYNPSTIGLIPAFISAVKNKDINSVSRTVATFLPRLTIINLATYYAVTKADEGEFDNAKLIKEDSQGLIFDDAITLFSSDPEILKIWPNKEDRSNTMNVVTSNIPTLLVSGEFDPVTPPINGIITKKHLSNSQHIIFKNNGHVPINGCFFNLAKQFLDNPSKKLDNSCANSSTTIRWN